jgi:antitoxin (DNA-binding transcriptional repressor) of toxin-antitoxin stability system
MLVISTRQFRENQRQYLGRVIKGEDVILKSRTEGSFKIVPITDYDSLINKDKLEAIIERGLQDIKDGKGKEYKLEELRIKMGI